MEDTLEELEKSLNLKDDDPEFNYKLDELRECKSHFLIKIRDYPTFDDLMGFLTTEFNWKYDDIIGLLNNRRKEFNKSYEKNKFYVKPSYFSIKKVEHKDENILVYYTNTLKELKFLVFKPDYVRLLYYYEGPDLPRANIYPLDKIENMTYRLYPVS